MKAIIVILTLLLTACAKSEPIQIPLAKQSSEDVCKLLGKQIGMNLTEDIDVTAEEIRSRIKSYTLTVTEDDCVTMSFVETEKIRHQQQPNNSIWLRILGGPRYE